MLLGIDASRTTVTHPTGTELYSLQLTRQLLRRGDKHRIRLYFRNEPADGLFSNVERRVIDRPRLWTHIGLKAELRRDPPDVVFIPAHVVPWRCPVPAVVTVHDMGYLHIPQAHRWRDRMYLDWSTRYSAHRAAAVIADSQSTKADLVQRYGIQDAKITVAYPGINPQIRLVSDRVALAKVRQQYGVPDRYILHVGTLQPRKNLSRLIEAYARLRTKMSDVPALVLVGGKGWLYDDLLRQVAGLGLAEHVQFVGYVVSERDLSALYSGAMLYAFPSLFEGFGFPLLEAMRCETPVVCSDTSSLPELAGDAALTFAPTDVNDMLDALLRVLTDDGLRAQLVERGRAQAARFTWEACGGQVLEIIERVAGAGA